MIGIILNGFFTIIIPKAIDVLFITAPFWGLLVLSKIFWEMWIMYATANFLAE
jgi:ATP/ADP translocase